MALEGGVGCLLRTWTSVADLPDLWRYAIQSSLYGFHMPWVSFSLLELWVSSQEQAPVHWPFRRAPRILTDSLLFPANKVPTYFCYQMLCRFFFDFINQSYLILKYFPCIVYYIFSYYCLVWVFSAFTWLRSLVYQMPWLSLKIAYFLTSLESAHAVYALCLSYLFEKYVQDQTLGEKGKKTKQD